jgi:hypothetical protein
MPALQQQKLPPSRSGPSTMRQVGQRMLPRGGQRIAILEERWVTICGGRSCGSAIRMRSSRPSTSPATKRLGQFLSQIDLQAGVARPDHRQGMRQQERPHGRDRPEAQGRCARLGLGLRPRLEIADPARISRARSARSRPTGVIRTEWVERSATCTPRRASISFRPVDSVDCVTWHSSAAREKFPVSASATRKRICRSVVIGYREKQITTVL